MSRLLLLVVIAVLPGLPTLARAQESVPPPDQRFHQAGEAFDSGDHRKAADLYRALIDDGYVSPPLLYNLGNAWYRLEDPGQAVLYYRRAWRLAPRDPDIRDNIAHTLDQAEVVPPQRNPIELLSCLLPRGTWAWIAVATYWLLALLLCLSFFQPRIRPAVRVTAGPSTALLAVSLVATWVWTWGRPGNEFVVVREGQQALYAPLADAHPHFDLPAGSIVTRRESEPGWIRVSLGGESGWLPDTVCTRVDEAPYL